MAFHSDKNKTMSLWFITVLLSYLICVSTEEDSSRMSLEERLKLRETARKMFYHAYNAYMDNAYPADELMPLSCKGRWKGITPSRGDMDDVLGNFSLTLVDSLDTLVILRDFSEFSRALKLVIKDVNFDQDMVVSVFETNIRMLGGLLSAHVLASKFKTDVPVLSWYNGELLSIAEDLGRRLLPSFNTTTGIPHGKINLRHGIKGIPESRETCTACAGTMILEMAALSRLTGNPIYEQKAHKAMDRLWKIRHRASDLMGTVINIHSGDWIRKDSGVGAGIDSYYEYCLKAYIMLGDDKYLARFNRHYNAVMKYISKGPMMLAVHMHRPQLQSRAFMDALLAFWPGLQVLLGDVLPAVETHEMLYQVTRRHTFLPEAFTSDFQVHWGQHPLRPEFLESTYFLHRATGDDHYLQVGKSALEALQQYAKVACGYAAVNDVRTRVHEDRMDSFVLAETFKYLFMLFGNDEDLPIDLEDYVLTTEAHFLPLSLATAGANTTDFRKYNDDEDVLKKSCPNTASLVAERVRRPMRHLIGAKSSKDAEEGLTYMQEMSKWNSLGDMENGVVPAGVRVGDKTLQAGPAHFGVALTRNHIYKGTAKTTVPLDACNTIENADEIVGKFAVVKRGSCPFAQKARNAEKAGATLAIVIDNVDDSSYTTTPLFAMSGDGDYEIAIPAVFLFSKEADHLLESMEAKPDVDITVGLLKTFETGTCDAPPAHDQHATHMHRILNQLAAHFDWNLPENYDDAVSMLRQKLDYRLKHLRKTDEDGLQLTKYELSKEYDKDVLSVSKDDASKDLFESNAQAASILENDPETENSKPADYGEELDKL